MPNVTPDSRTSKEHFALVLRLQQSRSNQPSDSTMRLRALALVKDVLRSRLDVDAEVNAQEYVHTQGFTDLGKALAASRVLQLAFEGFRSAAPAGRTNISVVLDSSGQEETVSTQAGPSVEQKELLASAKPAQVLITQAFYNRIAHCQPALRSSPLRAGIYEFLWTSEQRLAELQAEAEWVPTLVGDVVQPLALDETAVYQSIQPAPQPRWKEPEPPPVAPEPEPVVEVAEVPPRRSMKPVVAIGSAVAVLLVVGYLAYAFVLAGNHSKPVVRSSQATVSQPLIKEKPQPAMPPDAKLATEPAPKTAPPIPKPQKSAAVPAETQPPSSPATAKPARGCSIAGEVPDYLRLADSYRSKGDYERAITNYNLVLGCEPGNKLAMTGKRNAETAERYASP